MESLINDLATITTIPPNSLQRLKEKEIYIICNDVEESTLQNKNITEINIGIGTLIIEVKDNSINYKFIPSSKLEKNLISTIINKKNPLTYAMEESLANRIVKTYKDML